MPLYDTEYTHALIMAMVCSLAAFLLCWLWNLASAELHRHGAAKMFLFAALAVPLALWSVGKIGGGNPDGGVQMGGFLSPPASVASVDPPASDSGAPTNLQFTAFAACGGLWAYAIACPSSVLSPGDVVDIYATRDLKHGLWRIVDTFAATGLQSYTNMLADAEAQTPAASSLFLRAVDRTDDDGDGFPDVWSGCLHRLDSDGDGTPDIVETGCAEVLPDEDFLWFDLDSPWNGISGTHYWTNISADSLLGGVPRNYVQHCRDGFVNIVPDVNWPQNQISVWSDADSLFTTDYSSGGVTVMAMPVSLTGLAAYGSGLFSDSVVTNGCAYDVFLWKDVWPSAQPAATAPRATFEVILPASEPDTVYVSYLSVGEGFPGLGRRFGVQDASRRSAADASQFYVVSRLGTAGFPRARQTVKYTLGLNANPHADDGYIEPALPSSADTNAYFTVRVVAGAASVRVAFTGDGPGNLPDPQFLLGAGQETRVLLLKGKSYSVDATGAVVCSDPSDPAAEIVCADAEGKSWQVERPVAFSLVDEPGASSGPRVAVDPAAIDCTFSWTGVCRPGLDEEGVWRLTCSACGCGRCRVTGLATWEGYTKAVDLGFCRCLPEGDDAQTTIMCPDTLFNNDDSDRVTNSVDSSLGASTGPNDNPLADDDLVPVTVTFGVSNARGSALLSASGGKLRFWTSKDKQQERPLPLWIEDVALPHTVELWMEATDVSGSYEDQSLTLVWQSASGLHSGSVSKNITCVEPVVEPVCAEEKTVYEDRFIYNPSCLVNDGRPAYFKASWEPADYPASRVSWTNDNAQVRILGGSTGAEVCVWALGSAGVYSRLSLQFGDCPSARPAFGTEIVQSRVIDVLVASVVKVRGGREWHVDNREIDRASTIFAQAGIRLNVHMHSEPIEFRGADSIVAEEENSWSGLRMLVPETDGLVVMVVPVINGTSSGFSFGTGHREIVIDPNCVGDLLAHEIGHALGLEDIYGDSWDNPFGRKSLQRVVAHGCVSSEQFKKAQDWNGGSGARYYAYSFPRAYLIPRLLMCGSSLLAGSVDLPLSSVKGVGAVTENASFFQDVMCPVGCEDIFESQYAKEDEDE